MYNLFSKICYVGGGGEDRGVQFEDKFAQSKQGKVGQLQEPRLPEESKRAKGRLASLKSLRIREGMATGGYKTCKGGGGSFLKKTPPTFAFNALHQPN